MKALLVLVVLYVGAFLIATQGASQSPVEAASSGNSSGATLETRIDDAKRADIRSLMDLQGTRDDMRRLTAQQAEEFRENLVSALPEQQHEQFVPVLVTDYQKKFHADAVSEKLVASYDKHFSDDEIKGLLQFYNSPLGRKFAAEMPKIVSEGQAASREEGTRTATEVVQELPQQAPEAPVQASLTTGSSAPQRSKHTQNPTQPETLASASQP